MFLLFQINDFTFISSHHTFFGCLGYKIKMFDFGYSFRLFLTFPSQASNLQSLTVFLFMVIEVKMKSLLLAKGVWIFCQCNCFGQKSNLALIWEWDICDSGIVPTGAQL